MRGSIRDARCAGTKAAIEATTTNPATAVPMTAGGRPSTSYSTARAACSTPHAARTSERAPGEDHARHRREHHPLHLYRIGAEREAQAELARPGRHAVGQHAVQSDRHQERGGGREPRRQHRKRSDGFVQVVE